MRRRLPAVITALLLLAAYIVFLVIYEGSDQTEAPEIIIEGEHLYLSVTDDPAILLEGVTAQDAEDGELTDKIIVDSISEFDKNKNRTVRYVVFDSDNKSAIATRTISYTDYTAPTFYMTDSLAQNALSLSRINRMTGAVSCVDGDISNRVNIRTGSLVDNRMRLRISVTDSTGTESLLEVDYEYTRISYETLITLQDYIIYTPVGEVPDYKANITDITVSEISDMELVDAVEVLTEADYQTPGVYEVYYVIRTDAGTVTRCKAVVIVA